MARYKARAIWYDLANAFCAYITGHEHVTVMQQTIPGDDEQSVFIRVWEPESKPKPINKLCEFRVRDTILFRGDEILCVSSRHTTPSKLENDFRTINLNHPKAYEQLLDWMKLCGLVQAETTLTGELAPWREPEQCLKS